MGGLGMLHVSGMNIQRIIISIVFTLILGGCGRQMDRQNVKEELMNVDRAFSQLSSDKGSIEAFYSYMADDGIVLPKKGHPVKKDKYRKIISKENAADAKTILTWEPILSEVSESKDIGYTHGKYELIISDSTGTKNTTYGYYITIWKKQTDGNWKFVFDAGNESKTGE